jgi:hypothetical protein
MIGKKRLFINRFDCRVELKIYKSNGSHAQQYISLNMTERRSFLSQAPELLTKGGSMCADDTL